MSSARLRVETPDIALSPASHLQSQFPLASCQHLEAFFPFPLPHLATSHSSSLPRPLAQPSLLGAASYIISVFVPFLSVFSFALVWTSVNQFTVPFRSFATVGILDAGIGHEPRQSTSFCRLHFLLLWRHTFCEILPSLAVSTLPSSLADMPPSKKAPAKRHVLTLGQLSAYDDILTDALVDHVCLTGSHRMAATDHPRCFTGPQSLKIDPRTTRPEVW